MKILVEPKDGLRVRNPSNGSVISGRQEVEKTPAIIRMLNDGDLVEAQEVSAKKTGAGKDSSKKKTGG